MVDVLGFGGTEPHPLLDVWKQNLAIVHRISRLISTETSAKNNPFKFCRMLYFFPTRGRGYQNALTHASKGNWSYCSNFFGDLIFELMVVVCTNHQGDECQKLGFGQKDLDDVKKFFMFALKDITENAHSKLQVMYIEFKNKDDVNDTKTLLDRLKDTYEGTWKTGKVLKVDANACVICHENHPHKIIETEEQGNTGRLRKMLSLAFRCRSTSSVTHTKRMCHKEIQCNEASKSIVSHINSASNEMNEDEKRIYELCNQTECTNCHRPPGTIGCTKVDSNTRHRTIISSLLPNGQQLVTGELNTTITDGLPSDKTRCEQLTKGAIPITDMSSDKKEGDGQENDKFLYPILA